MSKTKDSIALRNYLDTMSRPYKSIAIDKIVKEAYVSRTTVFNWIYGYSRIPTLHKHKIEEIFKTKIFDFDESN